jgi:hypothetical protein
MSGIVALGQTQVLSLSTNAANVAMPASITKTFRVVNTAATGIAYVAVYNSATTAANIAKPTANNPCPGVVAITPGWPETISGNFGAQSEDTIYVAGISNGNLDIIITPVRD